MTVTYGVDFGTSRSSLTVWRSTGDLVDIAFEYGFSIPSSVCLTRDGVLLVGDQAEHVKLLNAGGYRRNFKRLIRTPEPLVLNGSPVAPVALVTEILRYLRDAARRTIPEEPKRVVLTVPTSWAEGERRLMHLAAEQAGFAHEAIRLVREPEAALRYALADQPPTRYRNVLVYDFGGGTFDCAIATATDSGYEALEWEGGRPHLGGAQLSLRVREILEARYPDALSPVDDESYHALRGLALDDECERIKCALSDAMSVAIGIPDHLHWHEVEEVTRPEFESRITAELDETFAACSELLNRAGLRWEDIDAIAPVGGSSRIPLVTEMLRQRTGCAIIAVRDPDLAVVRGAALLAGDEFATEVAPVPPAVFEPEPVRPDLASGIDDDPERAAPPERTPIVEPPRPAPSPTAAGWRPYRLTPGRRRPGPTTGAVLMFAVAAALAVVALLGAPGVGSPARGASGLLAVLAVPLGVILYRRGASVQRPPLRIGGEGICVDNLIHRWEDVERVRFEGVGVRGRHLVVVRFDSRPVPTISAAELSLAERDILQQCRRHAASRVVD